MPRMPELPQGEATHLWVIAAVAAIDGLWVEQGQGRSPVQEHGRRRHSILHLRFDPWLSTRIGLVAGVV